MTVFIFCLYTVVVKRRIYLVAHVDHFGGRLLPKEGNKNHYSVGLTTTTTRTQWVCAVWRVARPRRRRRQGTPSAVPLSTTETDGGVDNDGSDCGGSGSSGVPPVDNRVRFLRSEPLDCQSYRSSHAHTVSAFLTRSRITAATTDVAAVTITATAVRRLYRGSVRVRRAVHLDRYRTYV